MTKRLLFLTPLALLAILVAAFAVGLQRDPSVIPSTLIDKPLPAFALPNVYPGQPGLSNHDFHGEPRLLNVFASWCTACRIEHPLFMRLAGEGWPIYGLDWKDRATDAADWLTRLGDPYRRAANDEPGRTGIDLGVTGVPESYIIDKAGRVRYKHVGPVTAKDWEHTLKPIIEQLRNEA